MVKFDEKITEEIILLHENGVPLTNCADIVGVGRRTIYNWREKGEKAKSGKYRNFYLDMLKARGKFILYHQKKLNETKDWRCSQYLLQVSNPEHYVLENKLKVESKQEVNLNHNDFTSYFNDDLLREIIDDKEKKID